MAKISSGYRYATKTELLKLSLSLSAGEYSVLLQSLTNGHSYSVIIPKFPFKLNYVYNIF